MAQEAQRLQGGPVAQAILAQARVRAEALVARGIEPKLALVRVGENAGDLSYERSLRRRAEEAGVGIELYALPSNCTQAELEEVLHTANANTLVHGILMFRPLPSSLDEAQLCELIDPAKDVDGVTQSSLAGVFTGSGVGFAPSTAEACLRLLDFYQIPLEGMHAVVVGRSLVVGRPLAQLLLARNATVTLCHSRTQNLAEHCRSAQLLVACLGRARALGSDCLSAGQVVLDVGINFDETGALCGDVEYAAAQNTVAAITPVPGGIGSLTAALSIEHVVTAAEHLSAKT